MKLLESLSRIERIDQLVRLKATGTPAQLAQRLRLSERSVFNIIELMKNMGAPIYYNKARQSYCYQQNVEFKFGFYYKEGEAERLFGGTGKSFDFFSTLHFYCSPVK